MRKILSTAIIALFLLINTLSLAETNKTIQIKLGTSYSKINAMLGSPIKEVLTSAFWGNKKSLYRIGEKDYCIIEYIFGRVKSILFLEQVTEKEAMGKFNGENTILK